MDNNYFKTNLIRIQIISVVLIFFTIKFTNNAVFDGTNANKNLLYGNS